MSGLSTPELFLKPDAFVQYTDDGVVKKMSGIEAATYAALAPYSDRLHDDTVAVVIPTLLDYRPDTKLALLTHVGEFRHFSPLEYFGDSDIYTPEYWTAVHAAANILRSTVPPAEVPDQTDYEAVTDGRISSLAYLEAGLTGNETTDVAELFVIAGKAARNTQAVIEDLPQYASHRDPNPNNYLITRQGSGYRIAMVDWETFGLSRKGYDEGRVMSYLALDSTKQAAYAQDIRQLLDERERVYFWRIAMSRSLREIVSFGKGHYDSRLQAGGPDSHAAERDKQAIVEGLRSVIFRSVDALQELGISL